MFVKSDDAQIYYDVLGEGPDVVLLHAFPLNSYLWRSVAEQMAQRYRVTLIDLRAHGRSSTGEGPATMSRHVTDIVRVCKEVGIQRAYFGGVSIGGYILFELWRQHSEKVAALALCNTRATPDTAEGKATRLKSAEEVLQKGPEQFCEGMLARLVGETTRRNRQDIVESVLAMMSTATAKGIAAAQRGMAERPDSVPTLSTINVPTLIIAGEEDTLTPVSDAQHMQSLIRGSSLQVIPAAGHLAVHEKAQDAIRILRGFLDRL